MKPATGEGPYNPLDKANLAKSIEGELLSASVTPLADIGAIKGAGVYVVYYTGSFAPYAFVTARNLEDRFAQPIYIGKAIPKGGRKGGLTKDASKGTAIADRLRQHAASIDEAENLDLADFHFRYLVVDDIWIPLGENMLIETFQSVWNRAIDGFGNKDPGRRRKAQYKSPWDVLHPGRKFAEKLGDSGATQGFLIERVADYFAGRKLKPLPKKLAEQLAEEADEGLGDADELPLA
jgi:Eco29kI restriction endonuclease